MGAGSPDLMGRPLTRAALIIYGVDMADKITVLVIKGPTVAQARVMMQIKEIVPKEANIKKQFAEISPKITGCSLNSVFPGHTMRILDDGDPKQRRLAAEMYVPWTFEGLDEEIRGNAVIFKLEDSEPASTDLDIRDVQPALEILGKRG
jgi:hypothetical protein